ncbi:unnamed protein product [Linum trigynum]|uniref:Uncharacterized protein n=1 Tax=Linum trigynum TaxID=586398 RepID=A0AAV2EB38_9ROSI
MRESQFSSTSSRCVALQSSATGNKTASPALLSSSYPGVIPPLGSTILHPSGSCTVFRFLNVKPTAAFSATISGRRHPHSKSR